MSRKKGDPMVDDELEQTLKEVLDRHPAPALSLEELTALAVRERVGLEGDPKFLAQSLRRRRSDIRIVDTDPVRLGAITPQGWAVAPAGSRRGGFPARSLAGRLRETLRSLGQTLEPGSNTNLARWARMLSEERRLRRALDGRNGPTRGSPP